MPIAYTDTNSYVQDLTVYPPSLHLFSYKSLSVQLYLQYHKQELGEAHSYSKVLLYYKLRDLSGLPGSERSYFN
jgi:hypothetical protein